MVKIIKTSELDEATNVFYDHWLDGIAVGVQETSVPEAEVIEDVALGIKPHKVKRKKRKLASSKRPETPLSVDTTVFAEGTDLEGLQ